MQVLSHLQDVRAPDSLEAGLEEFESDKAELQSRVDDKDVKEGEQRCAARGG